MHKHSACWREATVDMLENLPQRQYMVPHYPGIIFLGIAGPIGKQRWINVSQLDDARWNAFDQDKAVAESNGATFVPESCETLGIGTAHGVSRLYVPNDGIEERIGGGMGHHTNAITSGTYIRKSSINSDAGSIPVISR